MTPCSLAGILTTLCTTDKVCGTGACDLVIKGKVGASTALHILHDLLSERDNMRGYAARCLHLIAEDPLVSLDDGTLVVCSSCTCAISSTQSSAAPLGFILPLLASVPFHLLARSISLLLCGQLWVPQLEGTLPASHC